MEKNMEYILLNKIKIKKPILFLCGPYYNESNKSDRRLILQNRIYTLYAKKYLPLVIDDFLTEKNINDQNIDIQLMEEICAAISAQTYIFLDTMSSAVELGIFANSAYANEIKVFIPKVDDIRNKGNVGYFVRDVVMKKHPTRVKYIEYRPKIDRKAIATDYIVEHYAFVGDKLPKNIDAIISEDPIFKQSDLHQLTLINSEDMPFEQYTICYVCNNCNLNIKISMKLLFYVTVSVILSIYQEELLTGNKDFSIFDMKIICENVSNSFKNYIEDTDKIDLSNVDMISLNTVIKVNQKDLICHIAKFVHVYYIYSRFHQFYLVEKSDVLNEIEVGSHPYLLLELSDEQKKLIQDIISNKEKYFEHITIIKKNRKQREIVKYKDNENGKMARKLHEHLHKKFCAIYVPDEHSFAYQRGKNIKQCVVKHINGIGFLKYDIKKFFNTISYEKLKKIFISKMKIDMRFSYIVDDILQVCFYEGKLPLGLVLSPILSDMYMYEFDLNMTRIVENEELVYTRYADDIMISKNRIIDENMTNNIEIQVSTLLKNIGLSLNKEKSTFINFDETHNFIRYVGINIVKGCNDNYLSVGKVYIYNIAKNYLSYCDKLIQVKSNKCSGEKLNKLQKDIFYERLIIIGEIGFLRQIEGNRGLDRLKRRLSKHRRDMNFDAI